MSSYIIFGNCNKFYLYIWLYIIIRIILEYLLRNDILTNKIKINYLKDEPFPKNILVQKTLYFIGITIFSMIIWKYQLRQDKRVKSHIISHNTQNTKLSSINFIYNDSKKNIKEVSCVLFCSIIILFFLSDQLIRIINSFQIKGLDYWMFEIIFICFINANIFKESIYSHKKVAIYIILIFSTSMKFISTLYILEDSDKKRLFKDYIWITPIIIIIFILLVFIRGYSYCRLKWLFDLKYISEFKLLIIYGLIGSVLCLFCCIIATNIQCIDKEDFNDITYFCKVSNNNNTYYDHFLIYFKDIWKEKREIWINILYVIILLIKIFLSFLLELFMVLIIKLLSPEYFICSFYIYY